MLLIEGLLYHPFQTFLLVAGACGLCYVIYQRFFHPLAAYPGPFLASLTDLWQVHQFLTLKQPYHLTELHAKYGQVVRYGPDKISITDEAAVPMLYQKGGKMFPKTEFYNAYGATHPNVFGMRNQTEHSIRRRHMSHSFSTSYVKDMEGYMDANISILMNKITAHCKSGTSFNLTEALHYYVIDVLGELAFSQSFGAQEANDEDHVPPVKEHSLLAAVTGSWPSMTAWLKKWLPVVPSKALHKLFEGRAACVALAGKCVTARLQDLEKARDDDNAASSQRKDILTSLILARHPDTGEKLTQMDLETEAFGFIIAGTHTTSATTSLLFYHLLHAPKLMSRLVDEIDAKLPDLGADVPVYSITAAESSLPFLRDCIKENFRITPVFTMPLARRVMDQAGVTIGAYHIPGGTSVAISNHAFHHNPVVWGADHNRFDPLRWENPATNQKSRLLMHFGLGGRQCIGKTVATTNIYKLMSTLLREFHFELADEQERSDVVSGLYLDKLPNMVSVGISDLEAPLMVKASVRGRKGDLRSVLENTL